MGTWRLPVALFLLSAGGAFSWQTGRGTMRLDVSGRPGGTLVVGQRTEPKTLNPVLAIDTSSREVIQRMTADLIHINRQTQHTEPALAESWSVSPDGKRYRLLLRKGLKFSDGHPFDAEDVLFTFQVYLDEKIQSAQRDLLIVGGKPLEVRKIDAYTVEFLLAEPYAAGERIFDSIAMLPAHLLRNDYQNGKLVQAWGLTVSPSRIAGLGPFRLKEYVPGERIVLDRNPYYWKSDRGGTPLPYLSSVAFLPCGNEDSLLARFKAGEIDVIDRVGARNFSVLEKAAKSGGYRMQDLGPSLDSNFLLLNQNDPETAPAAVRGSIGLFRSTPFRQAVSAAIDRQAVAKIVYDGHATPLSGNVSPANPTWLNKDIPKPARSLERAKKLLAAEGFSWPDGALHDRNGRKVEFTILSSANNAERTAIATVVQQDLGDIGIQARVVTVEFRAFVDRILRSRDYEAAVMGLSAGDVDPTSEMNVWLSNGATHLWNLGQSRPSTAWEAEIDDLMRKQMVTMDQEVRKRAYDRVQELIAENVPLIYIVCPNLFVGARAGLENFRPAVLDHHTLWNIEELYWREGH